MKNFTCVQDIGNLKSALDEAFEIKKTTVSNMWNWDVTKR